MAAAASAIRHRLDVTPRSPQASSPMGDWSDLVMEGWKSPIAESMTGHLADTLGSTRGSTTMWQTPRRGSTRGSAMGSSQTTMGFGQTFGSTMGSSQTTMGFASSVSSGPPPSPPRASPKGTPFSRGGIKRPLRGSGAMQTQQKQQHQMQNRQMLEQEMIRQRQLQQEVEEHQVQQQKVQAELHRQQHMFKQQQRDTKSSKAVGAPSNLTARRQTQQAFEVSMMNWLERPSETPVEDKLQVPKTEPARVFQAGDGANWEALASNAQEAALKLRRAAEASSSSQRHAARLNTSSTEKAILTGAILVYYTSANPLHLCEIDALRQAKVTLETMSQVAVVGAIVMPHADSYLTDRFVEDTRRLKFNDRLTLARMVISAAEEDSWILVDPCMEGCLKGHDGKVTPLITTYAKGRLRSPVLDPQVLQVMLEDPVNVIGCFNYNHVRVGAARIGFGYNHQETDSASHAGLDAALTARNLPSLSGMTEAWPTRKSIIGTSKEKAAPAKPTLVAPVDGIAANTAVAEEETSSVNVNLSGVKVVCSGGIRQGGGAEGPAGVRPLKHLNNVEAVVVDVPKLSQFEDLLWLAVKTPNDPSYWQVLERMCGPEAAHWIRVIVEKRQRFGMGLGRSR